MNTRSLRFRLVAWYAGWVTLLFVVFGVFVYGSLRHHLRSNLQEALARRTRQVADFVQRSKGTPEQVGHDIRDHWAPEANNRFTRVTANGVVTYLAGAPSDRSFNPASIPPAVDSGAGAETFELRRLPDGTGLFVVVLARSNGVNRLVIEEGSAEAPIRETLHDWLVVLVLGLGLLISGAVLGGFLLAQRALAPVDRITRSAELISSRNLSGRLPVSETGDEIQRLSVALNHMIQRLDDSFRHTQRFLADASHELRTPLTVLHAELDALGARDDAPVELRERADSALEEVERLRGIVEGLFALSRLDAGEALEQSEPFDLSELVATTADQMLLLAEDKDIRISCHAGTPILVEGDPARMKQVVVNLLDNAIKYTAPGGQIEIRVHSRYGWAVLEVVDTGIGIPAEARSEVFERFYRVDKARSRELGGAGLGLSIVKSICTAHGGRVDVVSEPGQGSCFIVELPLSSAATPNAER